MPRLVRERDFGPKPVDNTRELCFEGGDRIINLLDGELLVLNSEILNDESSFFGPSSPEFSKRGTSILHPKSGVEVKVLTYTLTYSLSDKVVILDSGVRPAPSLLPINAHQI